ncbi:MAG: hypothetical protein WCO57_00140 [Verrucomicrobiota bacterium]
MCHFLQVFRSRTPLAVMIVVHGLCNPLGCSAGAQVFTTQVIGTPPLGLRAILPGVGGSEFAPEEVFKGGFGYGIGVRSTYDSNFFLTKDNPENELTTNVLPWINYHSDTTGGAPFSLNASYQPNLRFYLNNPNINGVDHSGGVNMQVEGAKTLIAAYLNYSTVSGTDIYSGTFVNGSLLAGGVRGTYQIASRTSLFANFKVSMSDYGSGALVGSDTYSAEAGGFWSASERLSLGPSICYMKETSANTGDRNSWTLSMQAQYLMDEKFKFLGALGLQYSNNASDAGNSSLGLTGRLAANYAITENLQWETSARYATAPSPTDLNYMMNNLTLSTALRRQLLRATVSLGVEMNFSDFVEVVTTGTKLGNENNLSMLLSYQRKVFSERLDFDTSIRYSLNGGRQEWSQVQVSAGISFQF